MALTPPQRRLLDALLDHERSGLPISADEIQERTNWRPTTVRTYISKMLRPFLSETEPGRYRVSGIAALDQAGFQKVLTQSQAVRRTAAEDDFGSFLRGLNPWWEGQPSLPIPTKRRWIFQRLHRAFTAGLGAVTVLRGPRRVGKTVLLRQIIERLLAEGAEPRALLYVPFDELTRLQAPEVVLSIARWFEGFGAGYNQRTGPVYLILDEVQNLENWASQVKHLVDNYRVRVLITGSSSLRIQAEIDQLAGRLNILDVGPLLPREISVLSGRGDLAPFWEDNGQTRLLHREFWESARDHCRLHLDELNWSFRFFSERGGYPIAVERQDADWDEVAEWLRNNVVLQALQHDLVQLGWRDKEEVGFYYEVLRLACRYAGQCPAESALRRELLPVFGNELPEARVWQGLEFLEGARLLRCVRPLEYGSHKNRSPRKICLCDPSLRAAWLQEQVSLIDDSGALVGHLAESILGYALGGIPGLELGTFPGRGGVSEEVDFVLTIGAHRLPIEVKYQQSVDLRRDTAGLRAFRKRFPQTPFGLLITRELVDDPDDEVICLPLSWMLWLR